MRTQRTTVLAGFAALALLAGTSLASAQDKADQNAAPQTKQSQTTGQMNKAPAEKMGQNSQQKNMGAVEAPRSAQMNGKNAAQTADKHSAQMQMKSTNKTASENKTTTRNRMAQSERNKFGTKKHAMMRTERSKASRTAEESGRMTRQRSFAQQRGRNATQERQNTAQSERNGMQGLQGNASGMSVQLSNEQRDQIRTTVLNGRDAPRAGNVNFDVTVGTAIPHGFRIVPVPETLVRIEPRWRGFRYFVYQDEVVIVNPRDMRIVAVVMV